MIGLESMGSLIQKRFYKKQQIQSDCQLKYECVLYDEHINFILVPFTN